ncbi:TRAP transporter small permease [Litorivicinus sp.]|nr:TRAP transporter small permease [Litorivicinus sp.]MDC1240923.1 TRAP transporter small permease [Litorivicinus sp.]
MFVFVQIFSMLTYRLAQAAILGTLAIVTFEVIARYLFGSPTQSSLEITEYFIVAMGFLPIAAIYRTKGHVSVDMLTNLMPQKWRNGCELASIVVTGAFGFLVFWFGAEMTVHAYVSGTDSSSLLAFPMCLAYSVIPLGFLALGCESLNQICAHLNLDEGER